MAYRYTVPATSGRMKYKLKTGKKDVITDWLIRDNSVSFTSKYRQTELDKKKDVIVIEV